MPVLPALCTNQGHQSTSLCNITPIQSIIKSKGGNKVLTPLIFPKSESGEILLNLVPVLPALCTNQSHQSTSLCNITPIQLIIKSKGENKVLTPLIFPKSESGEILLNLVPVLPALCTNQGHQSTSLCNITPIQSIIKSKGENQSSNSSKIPEK